MVDDVNIMRDVRLFVRILITIVVVRYIIVCLSLCNYFLCGALSAKTTTTLGLLVNRNNKEVFDFGLSSSSPVIIKRRYWKLIVDIFRVSMEIAGKTSINTTSRRSRSWLFLLFVSPETDGWPR